MRCWGRVLGLALLAVLASVVGLRDRDAAPLVRTVTVGMGPSALAVDDQRGRVFVVNRGKNEAATRRTCCGSEFWTVYVPAKGRAWCRCDELPERRFPSKQNDSARR